MRQAGVTALGKLGEHAASAIPALAKYAKHKQEPVRDAAGRAMRLLPVHVITKCLEHKGRSVRDFAATTLGAL